MKINIKNVEELIFNDKNVWKRMPELVHLRDQWRMSRMAPMLRALGKRSLLDFLKSAKGHHEEALSEHFGVPVTIDKIESHIVLNKSFVLGDNPCLEDLEVYTGFSSYRDEEELHITFWR